MEFRQQILHPLVSDGTHRPDVDPRGDQHVVEDDPVKLCLLLKQLKTTTRRAQRSLGEDVGIFFLYVSLQMMMDECEP